MQPGTGSTREKGDLGEEMAADLLVRLGYCITSRKWRFARYELDLVAENETHIVFVEVKLRYSNTYGEPWEAVNKGKRKKICLSADAFIREFAIGKEPRFDIISIIRSGNKYEVLHIENAFWPTA